MMDRVSPAPAIRIMGVDTALRCTGIGLVEVQGQRMKALDYGVIKNKAGLPVSECLAAISRGITDLLQAHAPDAVAVEGIFYCRNVRTAVVLGQARGVVIGTCALADLPVYEYPPRRVKQAVVGYGAAGKEQMISMVSQLLSLKDVPSEDAADALGLAICHAHSMRGVQEPSRV